MASSGIRVGLVLVLVAITCGGAMAQSSCTNTLMTLSPCLNYVTGNSSSPSSSCCSRLGNVVQTSPLCLCSLLNNSGASLGVNRTLALNLPGACKIQTPSINQCKAASAPAASATPPVSSPASSPADSSDRTPEPDTTPSESDIPSASGTGSGSKTVPSSTGTSDGILAMMLCHGATAQSGCTGSLVSLAPCLNYVTGNSSAPSPPCCSQLATIVQSQPRCLCALVNGGGSSLGISINQTLALALPTACNVQTPPISRCNAADGPAAPPASSPGTPPSDTSDATPEAPTTVSTPSIPAGSGSKTVPPSTGTSDASIVRKQLHLDIFLIFSVLCASSVFGF
ncbi:hypothetical protein SADUNF_Sadunf05G0156500 [Salix dunnii]|uniref:Bifunctional inhibitor/plant lipid transfer protein/seed storage helical domain-containing protein n=1 Tax=Salix dunnii TaxID=1413687 RepID=A0A835K4E0_9ROSI|nr:hypothetical protein SADUNF_Sadunf05G0156500 [Salix dunnii]